jgi:hypothetical protein
MTPHAVVCINGLMHMMSQYDREVFVWCLGAARPRPSSANMSSFPTCLYCVVRHAPTLFELIGWDEDRRAFDKIATMRP